MRVFLAGATGVIGRELLPPLVQGGHAVTGMTRSQAQVEQIVRHGGEAVVCDVFGGNALREVVAAAKPDVVINQMTSIPAVLRPRHIAADMAATNRLRTEGTAALVEAAKAAGARRIVSQSIAIVYAPGGSGPAREDEPLHLDAPADFVSIAQAIAACERVTLETPGIDGLVLRYGLFYGPGTAYARDGSFAQGVLARQVPIVGDGGGVYSFIHSADAASATLAALQQNATGIYNIVDDEPAPVRVWLPRYAELLGAPPPRTVPRFLGRLGGGPYGVHLMTSLRGAANAKAREQLGWKPRYPSWREGFVAEFGAV